MKGKSEIFHCRMDYTTGDHKEVNSRVSYRTISKKDNRYLIIQSDFGDCIFPGGGIEEGETPEASLYRELKEETGYLASSEHVLIGICVLRKDDQYKVNASYEITCHYYTCEVEDEPVEVKLTPSEIALNIKALWMTKEEILESNKDYATKCINKDYWVEQMNWLLSRIE